MSNSEEARKLLHEVWTDGLDGCHDPFIDHHADRVQAALDAAERRGFERCREMAAEVCGVESADLDTTIDHPEVVWVSACMVCQIAIRALQYKEEE